MHDPDEIVIVGDNGNVCIQGLLLALEFTHQTKRRQSSGNI
jgi:hypothetical protein